MPPFSTKMRPNTQRANPSRKNKTSNEMSDPSDDVFESLSEVEQTTSKKPTKSRKTGAKPTRRSVRARAQSTATDSESSEYENEENDEDDEDDEDEEDDDTADEQVPSRSLKKMKKGHRTGLSMDFNERVEILSDFEDDSLSDDADIDDAAIEAYYENAKHGGGKGKAAEPIFFDDDNYEDVENLSDGSQLESEIDEVEEAAIMNDESSDALEDGVLDSFVEQAQRRSVRFQTPSSSSSSSATMNDHDIFIPDRNMFPDLETDLSHLQPFPITNSYFVDETRPSQSSAEEDLDVYEDFGSDGDTTDEEYYHPPAAIPLEELMHSKDTKPKSTRASNMKLSSYKPITPKGEKRKMPMIGTWNPEPTKPVVFIASNTPSKSSVVVHPARTPQTLQKLLPPLPPDFYAANFLDTHQHQSSDADFLALQEQVGAEYESADDEMLAQFLQTFDSDSASNPDTTSNASNSDDEEEQLSDSDAASDEVTGIASVTVDVDDDEKAETETTQVLGDSLKHLQRLDMLRATAFRNNQVNAMEKSKGHIAVTSGFAPGKFGAASETISPLAKRKRGGESGGRRKRVAVGI